MRVWMLKAKIINWWEFYRYPPTVRDLAKHMGYSSTTIHYYIEKLREEDWLLPARNCGGHIVPASIRISFKE